MGFSVDLLNKIRLWQDQDYKDRIPEATKNNLAEIGQAFSTYTVQFNKFNDAFIEKIGMTILSDKFFTNRLAWAKKGFVSPHDVEEIFTEMCKSEGAFDPEGKNPLGRRSGPDSYVIYHRLNRQETYAISLSDLDFRKVFTSEAVLDSYLAGKINAMYSGANRDEYLLTRNLIGSYKDKAGTGSGYVKYETTGMDDMAAYCKSFVKAVRKAVYDLTLEPSRNFNVAGVETWSEAKDLTLFVLSDVLVECDVELLAKAFHQSNTDLKVVPRIIPMSNWGSDAEGNLQLTDTQAILMDSDMLKIWDTRYKLLKQENAQGDFTNYFLHHDQILSMSTFKNAVRFCAKA